MRSLKNNLVGFYVRLDETAYTFLKEIGYNSIVLVNDTNYILYGPLQFVNHYCDSLLSLIDVKTGFSFRHEFEQDRYSTPLILRNEELLIKYIRKKELWFKCSCKKCVK